MKKASCEKRMIGFDFTEQEWQGLNELKTKVKCAYTNVAFVHQEGHKHQASLERIDHTKGYSPSNCVWCTFEANSLKAQYIENNLDDSDLTGVQASYLTRIRRIVESVTNLNRIREPYDKLYETMTKEENNMVTVVEQEEVIKVSNPDLVLSKEYFKFGSFIEDTCHAEFSITFAQYKKMMNIKKCQLSSRLLQDTTPALWVIDKTLPVNKENVLVIDIKLRDGLELMCNTAKLSLNELKTISGRLTKIIK